FIGLAYLSVGAAAINFLVVAPLVATLLQPVLKTNPENAVTNLVIVLVIFAANLVINILSIALAARINNVAVFTEIVGMVGFAVVVFIAWAIHPNHGLGFLLNTGSANTGGLLLVALPAAALMGLFSILALDVVGLAATGRLVFAMARDNILPGSGFLRVVNPQTRTPIRALVTASLLGLLFTLLGYYITVSGTGKDAFFALVGATSTLPFIVYFLTVLAYVLRRDRMATLPQAFNLGRWAKPVMFAALAWTLIALGLLMIPKI